MALSVDFTVSQSYLNVEGLSIFDISTGTDASITNRKVFLQTAYGTYLVESGNTQNFTNWAEPAASLTLQVLNQDYSLSILVQWCNVSGTVIYFKEQVYSFTLYSQQFYYYLTQQQAAGNANIQDTNYFNNKQKLKTFIDSANNAVQYASDIVGGQNSLDAAAYMIDHQNDYF